MRQKMLDHRVRSDCIQCHSMMDPIGFALENFDAIAQWRTQDEGNADRSDVALCSTARRSTGRPALRKWLVGYSDQFVAGRGREAADVRAWAAASNIRTCRSCARSREMPQRTATSSPRSFSIS